MYWFVWEVCSINGKLPRKALIEIIEIALMDRPTCTSKLSIFQFDDVNVSWTAILWAWLIGSVKRIYNRIPLFSKSPIAFVFSRLISTLPLRHDLWMQLLHLLHRERPSVPAFRALGVV